MTKQEYFLKKYSCLYHCAYSDMVSARASSPRIPLLLHFNFGCERANTVWTQFSFSNNFNMAEGQVKNKG